MGGMELIQDAGYFSRSVCTDSSRCPRSASSEKGCFPALVTGERSGHTFTQEIYALLLGRNGEDR